MEYLPIVKKTCPMKDGMGLAQVDALFEKTEQPIILFGKIPVEPVYIVVLTPTVIVSFFAVSKFVAGIDHRDSLGEQHDQDHAPHPPQTQILDSLAAGESFGAAVPAEVMVVAVTIFFAIALIVFFIITDQVGEGETIVTGEKVDGVKRVAQTGLVEVRAAGNPGSQVGHGIIKARHEGADIIAEHAVPFGPARIGGEGAHLIETGGVPGLGNDLGVAQDRVFGDHLDHGRIGQEVS